MAKTIVFDTGPIISLTTNNLIWVMEPLQKKFDGEFIITKSVYKELIERPLATKKYKFEALQILPYITKGIIKVIDSEKIKATADELHKIANNIFKAHGSPINIVHYGEMEAVSAALLTNASAIVIDERTTRTLIESPDLLKDILEKKLHTNIYVDEVNLNKIKDRLIGMPVLRSFELATISYELGLLDRYMPKEEEKIVPNIKKAVLEGVLWGVKLNGCSVKIDDIYSVIKMEELL